MAVEERLPRLENAFATLAELANSQHGRISTFEQSMQTLVELARSTDARMDQPLGWINQLGEAPANSGAKIAALADAQIWTEETLRELASRQLQPEAALTRLAESQAHTDQRLDALIDVVRKGRGSEPQG